MLVMEEQYRALAQALAAEAEAIPAHVAMRVINRFVHANEPRRETMVVMVVNEYDICRKRHWQLGACNV